MKANSELRTATIESERSEPAMRMSRVVRLMRLTAMLQSGRAYGTGELAAQFGVSRRTVFRDLRILEEVGFEKYFDPQVGGHRMAIAQGARVPGFARNELLALLLAARSSALNHIPSLHGELVSASNRLLGQCEAKLRQQLIHVLDAWQVEPMPALASQTAIRVVPLVLDALRDRRQVRITYRNDDGEPTRTRFSPYRVTLDEQGARLQGHASVHRKTVSIPLDAIDSVEPTDERYTFGKAGTGNGRAGKDAT